MFKGHIWIDNENSNAAKKEVKIDKDDKMDADHNVINHFSIIEDLLMSEDQALPDADILDPKDLMDLDVPNDNNLLETRHDLDMPHSLEIDTELAKYFAIIDKPIEYDANLEAFFENLQQAKDSEPNLAQTKTAISQNPNILFNTSKKRNADEAQLAEKFDNKRCKIF